MSTDAPLAGIRVLDLTTFLSGPVAARTLADLGADVIRVEPPRGDPTRAGTGLRPGDPPSAFYVALHRDRRSMVLDLKTDAGRGVLYDLVGVSDVLLENYRPGVTARLQISYDDVHPRNARLIYCTITGFGPDGPYSQLPATDGAVQAFGGVLELTGDRDQIGLPVPIPIADLVAGATAAQGVLAALVARYRNGEGTHLDVSMVEALLGWLLVGDREHTLAPPTTLVVHGSDGIPVLVQTSLHFQPRFAELLAAVPGCQNLVTDARFATRELRQEHRDDYERLVRRAFASRSSSEWLNALHAIGIPASTIQSVDEALQHPQLDHRAARGLVDVPGLGTQTVLASPFRFDGQRKTTTTSPPTLGEHTGVVLRAVAGYDDETVADLAARGAFGPGRVD
ncbi:MAG TPA: CaiB/BaiF CoA-transferase family protein [Acidimicrobiia bacterium]|nr:CaiB/BaiF CoA-transferase family protein [Acidimicrobiia bacterium]